MASSVNERLLNQTIAHHVGVQRLSAGAVRQVVNRLIQNDAEVIDVIRRRSGADGSFLPSRTEKLLGSIRNINARAYREIGVAVASWLYELSRYEAEFTRDLIESIMPVDWTVAIPKQRFTRAIVDEEPFFGGLWNEWIEGMASGRYTRVRSAIRIGIAAGETAEQVVRRIRGTRALGYRDGAFALSRRSADTVVSSFFNHVVNQARGSVYRENVNLITGVQWVAVLDDVTCEECAALEGTTYKNEDDATWPPLHPNCRCVLSPIIADWEWLELSEDELTAADKAALDGKRPRKITYDEWLESQDQETQDDILGRERAAMFRRGMPIKKFVDNSGRRYTLPELRRIETRRLRPKRGIMALNNIRPRHNYGWQPDLPDRRDYLFAVEHPQSIAAPVRVSLRDKMPPIWNQGSLGSCTAFAILAAAMFAMGKDTPLLSFLDLYYKERELEGTVNEDGGAQIRDGIKALAKWGVATDATWPYRVRKYRTHPPAAAHTEDDKFRIKKYMRLKSHEDFMRCLSMGVPFVGGFSVYENFTGDVVEEDGILPMPTVDQKMIGGHAVTFVGYDTDFHNNPAFKKSDLDKNDVPSLMYEARNSFGPDWGDQGYFWIPAPYVEDRDLSDDFWAIQA